MNLNLLVDVIPAKYRKYLYAAFALAVAVVQVLGMLDIDTGVANEVLAYIGIALGLTAAANTAPKRRNPDAPDQP